MNKHRTTGIDRAKSSFYLVTLTPQGKREGRTKLTRAKLLNFMVQQPVCTVAMEACTSSHYWASEIQNLGHRGQLLPAQHVKGYLRGQKNDYNDAQAIAEASQLGAIRPVPIKTIEHQDDQTFLQMRRHLSAEYAIDQPCSRATRRIWPGAEARKWRLEKSTTQYPG